MLAAIITSICVGTIPLIATLVAWRFARRSYEQEID